MGLNTTIIYRSTLPKNVTLDRKKKKLDYIIITKKHVFLYKNQATPNQADDQLLKKIIPHIEDEFFLV